MTHRIGAPWNAVKADRKLVVRIASDVLAELDAEAARQGRTLAWLMRWAWVMARADIMALPAEESLCKATQKGAA